MTKGDVHFLVSFYSIPKSGYPSIVLLVFKVYILVIVMSNKIRENPIKVKLSLNSLVKIVPKNVRPQMAPMSNKINM